MSSSDRSGNSSSGSRQKPSELPWYYKVKIRSRYDPVELVRRVERRGRRTKYPFETHEQAARETAKTIRFLEAVPTTIARLLCDRLRSCSPPKEPCGLTMCRVCIRQYRRAMASEILPHLHRKYDEGYRPFFATLIYSDPKLRTARRLTLAKIKSLRQRMRMLLVDYDLNHLMVVGSFEWDWSEKDGVWEPHCHLVFMAENKSSLKRKLKKYFRAENGVKQPTRISEEVPFDELPRALVYSLKFEPKLRVSRKRTERSRTKRPKLEGYEKYKSLKWLGMADPDEFAYRQRLQLLGPNGPNPRIVAADADESS